MLRYSDNAIVFDWKVLNGKQDIGEWELLFEENGNKKYGNGMSEFLEELTQLPQNKINVIFVNNLNLFQVVSSSYMGYGGNFNAGVKERSINFYLLSPFEFVEFRNCNNFWENISTDEFLRRLNLCRQNFKGRNKNRLSLKAHFKYTLALELWAAITEKYYLKTSTFQKIRDDLLPKDQIELDLLLNVYKASFVYANQAYQNKTINNVYSRDIKSSHSGFYLRKRYPYGAAMKEIDPQRIREIMDNDYYAWIGEFEFVGLFEKIKDLPWDLRNFGYVTKDGIWKLTLTNVHWKIFKKIYGAQNVIPRKFRYYTQTHLTKNYITMINELYQEKEHYKKTSNDDFVKGLFKMRTELPYGQSIKNPVYHTGVIYDEENNTFIQERLEEPKFETVIGKLKFYSLPFQYGIWTAAYSWAEEVDMIIKIGFDNVVYGDTDSVKFINEEGLKVIEEHNKEIDREFKEIVKKYYMEGMIDEKVGRWHDDGFNTQFKTLGMKRYLSLKQNGTIKVTCSGAMVSTLQKYFEKSKKPFDEFEKDMIIDGIYKHVYIDRKKRTVDVYYTNYLEEIDV